MAKKIFVTGAGIISALGVGKNATQQALLSSQSGIAPMQYLANTAHSYYPVGEVKLTNEAMMQMLDIPNDSTTIRTALMGMIAAQEAIDEAQFDRVKPKRVALISGTTVGGMDKSEQFYLDFFENRHCEYIAAHSCGASTGMIASRTGTYHTITTLSTACSSAANAIIHGANLIKTGRVDAAVVGGTECITLFHLNGFNTLMILDREQCRPFDMNRAGLNLGEGAAYLVLESEESVSARAIEPMCTLAGYANSCDAFHQTASSPNGDGAFLAMQGALKDANLQPSDIDYINAHGTGTPNNDISEGTAIMRLFADRVPPVSSTKSFTGHTTSAAGSVEAVISILSIRGGFIPANLNFKEKIAELNFTPVQRIITGTPVNRVLSNSFGFGGNSSTCIFTGING